MTTPQAAHVAVLEGMRDEARFVDMRDDEVEALNAAIAAMKREADGDYFSKNGQAILAQMLAEHGAVVGYLTAGRPDLALEVSLRVVNSVRDAAAIIRAEDAAAPTEASR
jgi:hypothetical protein